MAKLVRENDGQTDRGVVSMTIQFQQGKRSRNELQLPIQNFIVIDDWIEKLGEKPYIAWLRFYTWADRTDPNRDVDLIPASMANVAKRCGCSLPTLYKTIIRPLWNYGLIDLKEQMIGKTTYTNIVVYAYPQNNIERATKPLEKIRDYEQEYTSKSRECGRLGGHLSGQMRKHQLTTDRSDMPVTILQTIERNQLQSRLQEIKNVFDIVSTLEGFTNALFILTLNKPSLKKIAAEKSADVFTQYLLVAVNKNLSQLNHGQLTQAVRSDKQMLRDDLPASVKRQLEREKEGHPSGKKDGLLKDVISKDSEIAKLLMKLEKPRSHSILSAEESFGEHTLIEKQEDDRPF